MVFQTFRIHHGSQLFRAPFAHRPDTLDVKPESFCNHGYVDSLAAHVLAYFPDAVHLAQFQAFHLHRPVEAWIQADRSNHSLTPENIQDIITLPLLFRNRRR